MHPTKLDGAELARHRPQLLKFALAQLRDRATAEDAVQETLIAALEGMQRFAHGSSVSTWLIGILKHKIIDQFRRQSRDVPLYPAGEEEGEDPLDRLFREDGHLRDAPSDWGDPEAALNRREFFDVLHECLERLPKRAAQAFAMREISGLSTEDICKTLGISEVNCWVMLHRARLILRKLLEERWFNAQGRDAAPGRTRSKRKSTAPSADPAMTRAASSGVRAAMA
jgi:RNA polymerase sigma-70 factor (ECF subfamily)